MIKLLKKRTRPNRKKTAATDAANVDISRVIPGFSQEEDTELDTISSEVDEISNQLTETRSDPVPADSGNEQQDALAMEEKYQDWLKRDLERLTYGWTALKADIHNAASHQALFRVAHDLKGVGKTYGYPVISQLAHSLEALLKSDVWANNFDLIDLHINACRAAATAERTETDEIDAVSSSVCDALQTQVEHVCQRTRMAS